MSDFKYEEEYRELYKDSPLEDIMIFRSGPMASTYVKGMDFDDNSRALFEYALKTGINKRYVLVWIVKEPKEWCDKFSDFSNVVFISWEDADSENKEKRDTFFRYLCLAKYMFMTDSYGFALGCRKDQIRIMLWHGCGFKNRLGTASNEDHYEYMTVTGDEYAKTYARVFGLRADQMLVTGYPKVDYIFHPDKEWKKKLGIGNAAKYIFWLPTFRSTVTPGLEKHNHTVPKGETGLPVVGSLDEMRRINELLEKNDSVLIIKLHPFQNRELVCDMQEFSHIQLLDNETLLKQDIHINRIIGFSDALISDYSSVAVDYLVLDRPIGFTLDDLESYGKERGFFWDDVRPWLPGKEIYDSQEFYGFIEDVINSRDPGAEKRHSIDFLMQKYKDDQNSKRVFEALGIENKIV